MASQALTGETMPTRETRRVDGVFCFEGTTFAYRLDEVRHFNSFRAATLALYPADLRLGFDKTGWLSRCPQRRSSKVVVGRRSDRPYFRASTVATSNVRSGTRSQTSCRSSMAMDPRLDDVELRRGRGGTARTATSSGDSRSTLDADHASPCESGISAALMWRMPESTSA